MQMRWAYGITTVPQRRNNHFRVTLASLKKAGFSAPHLFVDSASSHSIADSYRVEFGLETTARSPGLGRYGNWILGLAELYIRHPTAHRFAMFQDDFITYPNLRQYLESCRFPEKGYWNLYTFPKNQALCPPGHTGWYESDQKGKGAVALVFSIEVVTKLLSRQHMIMKPRYIDKGTIDGAVAQSLTEYQNQKMGFIEMAGWREYVHNPSLVQHEGILSTIGNAPHPQATSFRGESFDALQLCAPVNSEIESSQPSPQPV